MNRRRFLGLGVGAAGATGAVVASRPAGTRALAEEDNLDGLAPDNLIGRSGSVNRAHEFLRLMMDAYQQGTTLRLVQSYSDSGDLGSTAFVADTALTIIARLQRHRKAELSRAALLGDSFLYAQAHDPIYTDGRLRAAYWVGPFTLPFAHNDAYFVRPDGTVNLVGAPWFFQGSGVADVAWAAIALGQLFARTDARRYLEGAVGLGNWIVDNAFDPGGLGGYTFGVDGNNVRLRHKSLEHNILAYALFTNLLAPLTGDPIWAARGQHAREFIERLWNGDGGFFYVGSPDGISIQLSPMAENTQSFSYLALRDRRFEGSLEWAKTNLATTDTPQSPHAGFTGNLRLSGVSASSVSRHSTQPESSTDPAPDPDAVWFEGTGHMGAALLDRRRRSSRDLPTFHGDVATAATYLSHCALAQDELGKGQTVNGIAIPGGLGLVAASGVLNSGFGFAYLPNLHIGATSWYLIAAHSDNPFQLQ